MKKSFILLLIVFLYGCSTFQKSNEPENVISYSYNKFGSTVDKLVPIFRQTDSVKHESYEFYYDALNNNPWDKIYSNYCRSKGWIIQGFQKWYDPRFCLSKDNKKIEYVWMTGTGSVSLSQPGYNHGGWANQRSMSGSKRYLVVLKPSNNISNQEKVTNMVSNIYNQVTSRK